MIVVSFTTVNAVPGMPSKFTPVAPRKPEPVTVTPVPPTTGPVFGTNDVMLEGIARNSKLRGAELPAGSRTTVPTTPGA